MIMSELGRALGLVIHLCSEFERFVGGGRLFALNVNVGTDESSSVGESLAAVVSTRAGSSS
jgi:hypothetical protein